MFRTHKISRLADLLEDPVVDLMMRSDGVDRRSVELLFERVGHSRRCEPARAEGAQLLPVVC
jgi:hypothetical protein